MKNQFVIVALLAMMSHVYVWWVKIMSKRKPKETYSEWSIGELKTLFSQGFISKGELKNALRIKKKYGGRK